MKVVRYLFLLCLVSIILPIGAIAANFVTPEMYGAKGDGINNDFIPFMKAIESGRRIKCDGIYLLSSTIHPSVSKNITIEGRGTLIYDFHINCSAHLRIGGIKLSNIGNEPNGLFASSGTASFFDVYFEGLSNNKLDGGISFKGKKLKIESCTFDKSDLNITSNSAVFEISKCVFDCRSVNTRDNLSNEPIHLQRCKKGSIRFCKFKDSLQDVIDFYFGAHNVTVSECQFDNITNTVFEIKAEYRDDNNKMGGNQVYKDFTSNILIKNNHFCKVSSQVLFWIGTRSDERTDSNEEDNYYVRNVTIANNVIDIVAEKCDVFLCRNAKNLTFEKNNISSVGSVFLFRSMPDNQYECNQNCILSNNCISCKDAILAYLQGHNLDVSFIGNYITRSSNDSFLLLQEQSSDIHDVTFEDNKVNDNKGFRIGTEYKSIHGKNIVFIQQSFNSCYVGSIDGSIEYKYCSFQCKPSISGVVNNLVITDCVSPSFISSGDILRMDIKKSLLSTPVEETITGRSAPLKVVSKRNKMKVK